MANLTPTPGWDNVPQLEPVTPALGGTGAPMNTQAQALLNRTQQLKNIVDGLSSSLDQVNNTSDLNKPISTATQAALDAKANSNNPTFTGTVSGITKSMVGLGNVDNTSDLSKPVSTSMQAALDTKAPLVDPSFSGTVTGITKSMVGLGNVDNTADLNKPVSTAQQNVLNLKANKAGDTFTGAVTATQFNGSGAGLTGTANSLTAGGANSVNGISGWNYTNWANNPAYIWCTEGSTGTQHLTAPGNLSVNYAVTAGTASGQDNCGAWGFVAGDGNKPYLRHSPSSAVRQLVWNLNNDSTVFCLRQVGNPGYLEVSGVNGAFSATLSPSDIRLKSNIKSSSVNASDIIERIEFIEYDMVRTSGQHVNLGFSAQNLETLDPSMVFDIEQPKESSLSDLGKVKNLNTTAIIAYLGKALQETLVRLKELEAEVDALKSAAA